MFILAVGGRGHQNLNRFQHVNVNILVIRLWMSIRICAFCILIDAIQAMSQPGTYGLTHIGSALGAALAGICIFKVVTGIPHPTSEWMQATTAICVLNICWLVGRFIIVNIMYSTDAASEGDTGEDTQEQQDASRYDANRRFGDAVLTMVMTVFFRYTMTLISAMHQIMGELGDQAFRVDVAQPPVETTATVAMASGRGTTSSSGARTPVATSSFVNDSATAYSRPYNQASSSRPVSGGQEEAGPPMAVAVVHNGDHSNGFGIPMTYATASAVKVEQDANALD